MTRKRVIEAGKAAHRVGADKAPRGSRKRSAAKPAPVPPPAPALVTSELRTVPIGKLNFARYNPRKTLTPGDREYKAIKASLETFGYVERLVWNARSETLVGGHQRLTILRDEFGLTEVEVSVVDLAGADERALNVTLNNVRGEWDDPRLAAVLAELRAAPGVDEKVTGFDDQQIADMIAVQELETELKPVTVKAPPVMTWVLIGIPTVRFGEINEQVESIAARDGVLVETTCNDG